MICYSFLSALRQNYARSAQVSLDSVAFQFRVLRPGETAGPGCHAVHGLSLEGARWDAVRGILVESEPKVRHEESVGKT